MNQPNGDIAKRNGGWPNMFGQIPLDNIGVQAGLHFSGVSNDLALAGWQCPSVQNISEWMEKSANPGAKSKQQGIPCWCPLGFYS